MSSFSFRQLELLARDSFELSQQNLRLRKSLGDTRKSSLEEEGKRSQRIHSQSLPSSPEMNSLSSGYTLDHSIPSGNTPGQEWRNVDKSNPGVAPMAPTDAEEGICAT